MVCQYVGGGPGEGGFVFGGLTGAVVKLVVCKCPCRSLLIGHAWGFFPLLLLVLLELALSFDT